MTCEYFPTYNFPLPMYYFNNIEPLLTASYGLKRVKKRIVDIFRLSTKRQF